MSVIARKLETIKQKGGMRLVDVANVLGARPETVSRWNQGKAFPHSSTEKLLLELEWVVDQLSEVYGPREARMWLFSRQKALDGKIPAELIAQSEIDKVLEVIGQLRDALFT